MQQQAPQQSGGLLSGLGSTIAQGFAFGTGSSLARHAVDSMMGGGGSAPAAQAPAAPAPQQYSNAACDVDQKALMQCFQNGGNASSCEFYFNALQQCQQANGH
jgi:hypothetical protein